MIYLEIFFLTLIFLFATWPSLANTLIPIGIDLSADIKGALAGGIVSALIDRSHTKVHRFTNGVGSVAFSFIMTPGLVSLINWGLGVTKTDGLIQLVSGILALVGVILAEGIQRIAKRLLFRSEDIADKMVDKYLPGDKDK